MRVADVTNKCCPFDEDSILTTTVAIGDNPYQVLVNDCGNVLVTDIVEDCL